MILTRVRLNPFHPQTYRLLGNPYHLHQALTAVMECKRHENNILFRIDENTTIFVQSDAPGNWDNFASDRVIEGVDSKPFNPDLKPGQLLMFRLVCRPCVKSKVEGSKNSRFRYLRTEDARLAWLRRRGEQAGFELISSNETPQEWFDNKPDPTEPDERPRSRPLGATRFDGVLRITDPGKLKEALHKGIGPQKAYGFGLLSLAPYRE